MRGRTRSKERKGSRLSRHQRSQVIRSGTATAPPAVVGAAAPAGIRPGTPGAAPGVVGAEGEEPGYPAPGPGVEGPGVSGPGVAGPEGPGVAGPGGLGAGS